MPRVLKPLQISAQTQRAIWQRQGRPPLSDKREWSEKPGHVLLEVPVFFQEKDSIIQGAQRVAEHGAESYTEWTRIVGPCARSEAD